MERQGNYVDLLISLLVRFPQIGTVYYEPKEEALRLVFLLREVQNDFTEFTQLLKAHLTFFHSLGQEEVGLTSLKKTETKGITTIEIMRELKSLSLEELNLIVSLVADFYSSGLIQDGPEVDEDDQIEHNMNIDSFFDSRPHRGMERLTGFRDNGRVLVFSVPSVGVGKS